MTPQRLQHPAVLFLATLQTVVEQAEKLCGFEGRIN